MGTPIELLKFYQSKKWKDVRAYVRRRDHGLCQSCGSIGQEVHHVVALSLRNYQSEIAIDPNNLVLLCKSCHDAQRASERLRDDVMFDGQGRLIQRRKTPPTT